MLMTTTCARRVVLVDDDAAFRALVRAQLETAGGFEVVAEAESGVEGLALVEQLHPEAVVIDFAMPRMNGLQAACAIEEQWPEIIVVMLTGSDLDVHLQHLLREHTAALLSKDHFDPDALVAALLGTWTSSHLTGARDDDQSARTVGGTVGGF
jgi:DNA-binding NarL/FixJ family response regulator